MAKKSTIYDIARLTNLSTATVSRIINQKGSYSQRSEELVLEAMRALGYYPNARAGSSGSRERAIGLMMTSSGNRVLESDNLFYLEFLGGVAVEAQRQGYSLYLPHRFDQESLPGLIHQNQIAGFIMADIYMAPLIKEMMLQGFPVTYVGQRLPEDAGGHNVYGGYAEYKRDALEYLYGEGYRNIVAFESYDQKEEGFRVETFRKILEDFRREKGLRQDQCRMTLYDSYDPDQPKLLLQTTVGSGRRPDAIYLDSTKTAGAAYQVIRAAGLRIPEDVAVIATSHTAFGGEEFSPPLTTITMDVREMGARAVRLLLRQIGDCQEDVDHFVPYQIIGRQSTGGLR